MFQIYPCSQQAMDYIRKRQANPPEYHRPGPKYPFAQLEVGQSFSVPTDKYDNFRPYNSIQAMASMLAPHLGKRFRVILHKELEIIEVARVE